MDKLMVLVVDDSKERLDAFREKLAGDGIQLITAECYHEAVMVLDNMHVDVVFLDHDLGPGRSGYDIAYHIYENPSCKPTYIYIHSTNIVGAPRMASLLPGSVLCPFVWLRPKEELMLLLRREEV